MTAAQRNKDHSNRLTGIQIIEFSGNRSSRQKINSNLEHVNKKINVLYLMAYQNIAPNSCRVHTLFKCTWNTRIDYMLDHKGFLGDSAGKNPPAMQETLV